jgi:CRISPR system Cascade subunit CasA
MTYDLLERRWLPVRRPDGALALLGLRDALRESHRISSLVGDIATQEAALLRLMLAVVLRAYRTELARDDEDGWASLWNEQSLPEKPLLGYLEEHRQRFDLLHPEAPFLQTAGLRTAKDSMTEVVTLLPDVRNNDRLFSTRAGVGLDVLPTAEAARWVVTCHAFDPSGIKSGAVDDPRVKGGKGYPIGTGWVGQLGLVLAQGRTLRETLLLNLARPEAWRVDDDLPAWERPPLTGAPQNRPAGPTGPVDLFTWPSRRIRLVGDDEQVTNVLICNGDQLLPQDKHQLEPMSGWRNSRNQAKKLGRPRVFMPRTHDPERAMWRGLGSLLEHRNAGSDNETVPPMTLEWLGHLRDEDLLAKDHPIVLRTIGMTYGAQSAVESGMVDEALPLPAALLGAAGVAARGVALTAVERADTVGQAVGQLARNLMQAAGGDGGGEGAAARGDFFFALETPYARWLSTLPTADLDQATLTWQRVVDQQARRQARRLLGATSPASWVGRDVGPRDRQSHVNAFLADIWFRKALAKALPALAPVTAGEPPSPPSPMQESA